MATTTLEVPFAGIHGRLDHSSEMYYAKRLGRTVVSHYPKRRNPKTISERQKALNANFQAAVQQAAAELADPSHRAYWQALFDKQPTPQRYRILRNFVIAQLTKKQA